MLLEKMPCQHCSEHSDYPINTNCRVKRHFLTTCTHEHGRPAELKPDSTIYAQGVKMGGILEDPKLDSKVRRIFS